VAEPPAGGGGSWAWRVTRSFGLFWWQFFVGDTPEILVGVLAVLGLVVGLVAVGAPRLILVFALPLGVLGVLAWSLRRAIRRK
jgi:hypothetical protein